MDFAQEPPCPNIVRGQEDLTPEQKAYADQFAQERIAAMLSTAAIDEAEAEDHLRAAYRVAGLGPVPVRWFDSPLGFALAFVSRLEASEKEIGRDSVLEGGLSSVAESVAESVWISVAESVQARVMDRVRGRVWDSVIESVVDRVWDGLWDSLRGKFWERVWDSVLDRVSDWVSDSEEEDSEGEGVRISVWDSVQAYSYEPRLSFLRFFHEMVEGNELIHFACFNELVCGYGLGRKEAWVVRKPIRLERDAQGRLHSVDGMAIQFRDGWGVYAWHGVGVPEYVIVQPETLTREDWLNERNLEVRRVMQERMPNFVETIGAQWLDTGKHGSLYAVDLAPDPEEVAHYVHVQDSSSARSYYLRVPPTIYRADEAVAWTFGLSEEEYQPAQEA